VKETGRPGSADGHEGIRKTGGGRLGETRVRRVDVEALPFLSYPSSRQNATQHLRGFHAGQPLVEALELEGKPFVVQPELMEDRGV